MIFYFQISCTNIFFLVKPYVSIESWKVFLLLSVFLWLITHFFNRFFIFIIIRIQVNYHLVVVFVFLRYFFAYYLNLWDFLRIGVWRWMVFSFLLIFFLLSVLFSILTFGRVIYFFIAFGWEGYNSSLIEIVGFLENDILGHIEFHERSIIKEGIAFKVVFFIGRVVVI